MQSTPEATRGYREPAERPAGDDPELTRLEEEHRVALAETTPSFLRNRALFAVGLATAFLLLLILGLIAAKGAWRLDIVLKMTSPAFLVLPLEYGYIRWSLRQKNTERLQEAQRRLRERQEFVELQRRVNDAESRAAHHEAVRVPDPSFEEASDEASLDLVRSRKAR